MIHHLHKQPANRADTDWVSVDNLTLPIMESSTFPLRVSLPLFTSKVSAGFPSPADDHLEASIDLNQHAIKHPLRLSLLRCV
ncbi:MAG: hypothetical protein K9L60_11375 [Methylovulum sp.]|nr:hypothetical protein [Methylovulum sp.]MCF7999643.1 hypothetical protein [Methylovulum sp.]